MNGKIKFKTNTIYVKQPIRHGNKTELTNTNTWCYKKTRNSLPMVFLVSEKTSSQQASTITMKGNISINELEAARVEAPANKKR